MSIQLSASLLAFLLFALFCITAMGTALRNLHKRDSKKQFNLSGKFFFYRHFHALFFQQELEELYFANTLSQNLLRFSYALISFLLLRQAGLISWVVNSQSGTYYLDLHWPAGIFSLIGLFLLYFLIGDYLARIVGNRYSERTLQLCAPIASVFMILLFPLTFLFLKFSHAFSKTVYFNPLNEFEPEAKQEIFDMIEESNFTATQLDPHDRKMIESVMAFKDRIAREVMVPRVDIFSLAHTTTIEEAATFLHNEGYSRTPVYKNTLDNIIGVLMYKDILAKYMDYARSKNPAILQAPISTLIKNVLYTPETKKISHLLQEFRKKQVHLAIIVDEYGGTEGIVTIEDILEEIVGEIADEYDEEEALFLPLSEGGWLIDARMTIFDIEEQFGIEIPQDGDYDTIGGYIFHETGTIPAKGFILQQPYFEIEVVRSNDRRVEKLRIRPLGDELEE
ncbi:MAG: hemolysin family protein [Parachlamydia sp.]|nr:hemolysin family protein [Parachlamydia sp.]